MNEKEDREVVLDLPTFHCMCPAACPVDRPTIICRGRCCPFWNSYLSLTIFICFNTDRLHLAKKYPFPSLIDPPREDGQAWLPRIPLRSVRLNDQNVPVTLLRVKYSQRLAQNVPEQSAPPQRSENSTHLSSPWERPIRFGETLEVDCLVIRTTIFTPWRTSCANLFEDMRVPRSHMISMRLDRGHIAMEIGLIQNNLQTK